MKKKVVKNEVKITQRQADAAVKGFMAHLYGRGVLDRLRWCSTAMRKGKKENRKYLYTVLSIVSFLSGVGVFHLVSAVIKFFK